MSWQMLLASCAAQNLVPGLPPAPNPAAPVSQEWLSSPKGPSVVLSNLNRDAGNSGANNGNGIAQAGKAIKPSHGRVYWEIEIVSLGAATTYHQVGFVTNQCYGLTSKADLSLYSGVHYANYNATYGRVNVNNGLVVTAMPSINTAGTVVQFVVEPYTGKAWIGINNAWVNSKDPNVTDEPLVFFASGQFVYPAVNPRDNGDVLRLCSITSEFAYAVPTGCKPYGNDLVNFNLDEFELKNVYLVSNTTEWSFDTAGGGASSAGVQTIASGYGGGNGFAFGKINERNNGDPSSPIPGTSGATFVEMYQEYTPDIRFGDLIDNNEMQLELSMFVSRFGTWPNDNYPVKLGAAFYDGSGTIIGTALYSAAYNPSVGFELMTQSYAIPALTRKIRYRIYTSKQNGNNIPKNALTGFRAFLRRKMPLVAIEVITPPQIILGLRPDQLGLVASNSFAIITP